MVGMVDFWWGMGEISGEMVVVCDEMGGFFGEMVSFRYARIYWVFYVVNRGLFNTYWVFFRPYW